MTPQELKNSILQLAIQGKLVPQRTEEGIAEELYNQIQSEKQKLIKAGKIKKEKPLSAITDEEKPFEIPESWKWVRFGNISQLLDGEKCEGLKYPYLTVKYLRGISEKTLESKGKFISKGTKVILVDGENSGEVFHAHEDGYMGSTFKVLYFSQILCEFYVLYFLLYHKKDYRNNKKGSAIPHLDKTLFFNMLFPIPPLAEQKRIVAKIEELLPYVERYEKAYNELQQLNKRFPGDLQKSVLQLAIQGRLVPQRAEEGSAEELYNQIQTEKQKLIKAGKIKKEKPLPAITDEEKPFEIPDSWKWVRLGEVCDVRDGTHDTPQYVIEGYPLITGKDFYNGYFDLKKTQYVSQEDYLEISKRSKVEISDILFSMIGGNIGSMIMITNDNYFDMAIKNVALFKQYRNELLFPNYLFYFLKSQTLNMKKGAKGGAQMFVSLNFLRNYYFPLPPLPEQKRIVAKLEEILPLCDKLK